MIVEGELKDYLVIPIEDLIDMENNFKSLNVLASLPETKIKMQTKIELIEQIINEYSKDKLI